MNSCKNCFNNCVCHYYHEAGKHLLDAQKSIEHCISDDIDGYRNRETKILIQEDKIFRAREVFYEAIASICKYYLQQNGG